MKSSDGNDKENVRFAATKAKAYNVLDENILDRLIWVIFLDLTLMDIFQERKANSLR